MLALHAVRRAPAGTTVLLIERSHRFGNGLAYGSGNPHHLLNVPAGRMSAFDDRPTDFLQWLHGHPPWQDCAGQDFVPRHAFGAYVRDLLKAELRRRDGASRLVLVRGDVQCMQPHGSEIHIHLDRDRRFSAELAVLATGNPPPKAPPVDDPRLYDSAFFRPDPWQPDALDGLDPAGPVLLIGTGLTAVDTVISLLDRGHTGPITAISRRGLLPRRHGPAAPVDLGPSLPTGVVALLRFVRGTARQAMAHGGSWQGSVDALRPFSQDLWQTMTLRERAAFLRHLRPWWDVHRHRMAPAVAERHRCGTGFGPTPHGGWPDPALPARRRRQRGGAMARAAGRCRDADGQPRDQLPPDRRSITGGPAIRCFVCCWRPAWRDPTRCIWAWT